LAFYLKGICERKVGSKRALLFGAKIFFSNYIKEK